MNLQAVRWRRAIGGAALAEIAQIATAFLWVAIYSYLINRDQPVAVYQQHARDSGPWVSIVAGFPIFLLASRWIAQSVPTALALFGVFVAIDGLLLLLASVPLSAPLVAFAGTSFLTKLLACYLGGRQGEASPRRLPA